MDIAAFVLDELAAADLAASSSGFPYCAARETFLPADCVAFTVLAVSAPTPRIVLAQAADISAAARTAMVAMRELVICRPSGLFRSQNEKMLK